MPKLDPIDSSRLLAGLDQLYALGPMSEFSCRALDVARGLVSCEVASFNEFDLRSGAFRVVADPLPPAPRS
jgi:hypothetical protein